MRRQDLPKLLFCQLLPFDSLSQSIAYHQPLGNIAEKLKSQKNITVDYEEITGANHFYDNETDKLERTIRSYIERELNSKYR